MTKSIFLVSLLGIIILAGCNQKNLVDQIDGDWHVQKYAIDGKDQTRLFDSLYTGFRWSFSGTKNFTQSYTAIRIFNLYTLDTITHMDSAAHTIVIDSVTTSVAVVPAGYTINIKGDWYLTNGNHFLETRDSTTGNKLYQIIDHSKNSLHLLNGNVDYYLAQ